MPLKTRRRSLRAPMRSQSSTLRSSSRCHLTFGEPAACAFVLLIGSYNEMGGWLIRFSFYYPSPRRPAITTASSTPGTLRRIRSLPSRRGFGAPPHPKAYTPESSCHLDNHNGLCVDSAYSNQKLCSVAKVSGFDYLVSYTSFKPILLAAQGGNSWVQHLQTPQQYEHHEGVSVGFY